MTKSKLGTALLAFVIAFGLWLYVVTFVSTEHEDTYHNVPVALEGQTQLAERNLILLSEEDYRVTLVIKGNRQDMGKINAGNLQLVANLGGIYDPGTHNLDYTVSYPGDVPQGAVELQSKTPDRVTVVVARKTSKQVPVVVNYLGDVPADYIKDTAAATLDSKYVTVEGPEEVVAQIDHAAINVDCEGRTESIYESYRYELQNIDNEPVDAAWITTDVAEVGFYLPIAMVKTVPLTLTINNGGGATEETATIVIDPKEISVSGNETALSVLESINLGTIDLGEITEDTVLEFPINVPQGLTNISNLTTATVHISFPRLAMKEFVITEFQTRNVPEGMEVVMLTKQITITVRGLKEQIRAMALEDIVVQLDLTGVENTSAVEPAITFGTGFESVGAVGSYSVSVQVKPIEVEEN